MIPVLHRVQEKQAPPGIGVEIDVWMHWSGVIVSHDRPQPEGDCYLDTWLRLDVACHGFRPLYAVNCKTDCLEQEVSKSFDRYGVPRDRWFAFDCSYPSQRLFEKLGLPFAERVSEEEPWRARSHRIWLDRWTWRDNGAALTGSAFGIKRTPAAYSGNGIYLPTLDSKGHKIEIHAVSMELHVPDAADHERRNWWRWLFDEVRPASVCTDYPDDLMRTWEEWKAG